MYCRCVLLHCVLLHYVLLQYTVHTMCSTHFVQYTNKVLPHYDTKAEKHCIWCGRCSPSHLTWEGVDSVTPKPGGCSLLVQKLWGNASFWHLLFNMSLQQQYLESCYIIREVALIFGLSNQMTEYESIKSTKMQKHKREKYKNIKTQKC